MYITYLFFYLKLDFLHPGKKIFRHFIAMIVLYLITTLN